MENIYSEERISKSKALIEGAKNIVITTHRSPDGDAIGSSLGLWHILRSLGKEVVVIVPDNYPEFLHWLPGNDAVKVFDEQKDECRSILEKADLLFSLDYNILTRTGNLAEELEKLDRPFILIDHHQQPGDYPAVTFSDTTACSTAEMIYNFAEASGWESQIGVEAGECLYTGIMTDSGSFRFPNVSAGTHHIVAKLIDQGVEHSKIHQNVYDNNLLNRLKLIGYALSEKLEQIDGTKAAMIILSREELARFNFQPGDTEGLVNYALSIKGINLAIFAREGSNIVKLSFRSIGKFDVNKFARTYFNGGGHMNAAGGAIDLSLEEVEKKLIDAVIAHKDELDY